ncbi:MULTISPECIES: TetR family transcriptional regulator [unclassified Streptomyces]|uniref:TetR/AcrR family transcriptional regulator n=1 Tax=unclassified Streptomyces TaxID=2593676 RepID=UPI00288A3A08|nr:MULTISPECIES: TetR family transcriptional regulator [unclassified Streptomyces]WNI21422.1 TetR family transcriptional regulator [Streptomyces sp. ITFR-16]WNI28240.1 TetR family transcriptional regulator [Streptomyces sp. ITFR-6]
MSATTPAGAQPTAAGRPRRDAAGSRDRLLKAASELFAEHGYDRTTARAIGSRAGVDPTMIARYFGGKAQLYVATLRMGDGPNEIVDLLDPGRLAVILDLTRRRGPNPIYQVAVRPHDDPAGQTATREELHRRVIEPLRRRLSAEGVDQPELRAEIIASAFIGVVLARTSGAFDHLPDVRDDVLGALLLDMLSPEPPLSRRADGRLPDTGS